MVEPPVQTPLWQESPVVQTLLSLQAVPFATGVKTQPTPGWQLSAVQGLLSLQTTGVDPG